GRRHRILFFFQAEDGIRDRNVTGVQTCALPISRNIRLFNRRMFRGLLFGSVCLATLIALVYAEEDWRGKRAWENFKREWEARGEIGRASCRERVESSGGEVAREQTRR